MKPYYEHNGITIYHGDCREILPQIGRCDAVITDPPYGVSFQYASHDDTPGRDYSALLREFLEWSRNIAPIVLLTTGMRNLWMYPPADWVLCWAKPGSTRRSDLGGFNEWEPVLVYGKPRIYNDYKYLPDCVNHTRGFGREHPCPKPIALLKWLTETATEANHLIVDPFAGSGTTLQAAKDLNRRAIGIEIEEKYCEIAAKRLSQEVVQFEAARE